MGIAQGRFIYPYKVEMQHFKQGERSLIGEASLIGRKVKTSVFLQSASLTILREVTH